MTMQIRRIAFALLIVAATVGVQARVNPKLKGVHKIFVAELQSMAKRHGRLMVAESGSNTEVRDRLIANISSSERFSAVSDESRADTRIEGAAGKVNSVENGKKYTTGFAQLQLIDIKSKEIVWVFEYQPKEGAGGRAADRVADQFIDKLLADAKAADSK